MFTMFSSNCSGAIVQPGTACSTSGTMQLGYYLCRTSHSMNCTCEHWKHNGGARMGRDLPKRNPSLKLLQPTQLDTQFNTTHRVTKPKKCEHLLDSMAGGARLATSDWESRLVYQSRMKSVRCSSRSDLGV